MRPHPHVIYHRLLYINALRMWRHHRLQQWGGWSWLWGQVSIFISLILKLQPEYLSLCNKPQWTLTPWPHSGERTHNHPMLCDRGRKTVSSIQILLAIDRQRLLKSSKSRTAIDGHRWASSASMAILFWEVLTLRNAHRVSTVIEKFYLFRKMVENAK